MQISEFDLAAAISSEPRGIAALVREWQKREEDRRTTESRGFNPYSHVVRYVLGGCMNPGERDQILAKVRGYNRRMLPDRNSMLIERTWELFDSMGGQATGNGPYQSTLPGLTVNVSAAYIYQLPGLEYVIVP